MENTLGTLLHPYLSMHEIKHVSVQLSPKKHFGNKVMEILNHILRAMRYFNALFSKKIKVDRSYSFIVRILRNWILTVDSCISDEVRVKSVSSIPSSEGNVYFVVYE